MNVWNRFCFFHWHRIETVLRASPATFHQVGSKYSLVLSHTFKNSLMSPCVYLAEVCLKFELIILEDSLEVQFSTPLIFPNRISCWLSLKSHLENNTDVEYESSHTTSTESSIHIHYTKKIDVHIDCISMDDVYPGFDLKQVISYELCRIIILRWSKYHFKRALKSRLWCVGLLFEQWKALVCIFSFCTNPSRILCLSPSFENEWYVINFTRIPFLCVLSMWIERKSIFSN